MTEGRLPSTAEESVWWMEQVVLHLHTEPHNAEKALMELRAAPLAIDIAKAVLERSSVPLAQFHAITTIEAVALQRWESLATEQRSAVRDLVWQEALRLTVCTPQAERYVISQIAHAIAVLCKRSWIHEESCAKEAWFVEVRNLLESPDQHLNLFATGLLLMLVEEFGSSKATRVNLPVEFHKLARASFEDFGLTQTLELSIGLLGRVLSLHQLSGSNFAKNAIGPQLAVGAVKLNAEVVSWEFKPQEEWQAPVVNQLLTPSPSWWSLIVRSDILRLVFEAYNAVRPLCISHFSPLAHSLRQLLLQLASISGGIMVPTEGRSFYMSTLTDGIAAMIPPTFPVDLEKDVEARGDFEFVVQERIDLATISTRIVSNFGLLALISMPNAMFFISNLAELTTSLLRYASLTSAVLLDSLDNSFMECFSELLQCWVLIFSDDSLSDGRLEFSSKDKLRSLARNIYENYATARFSISREDGMRSVLDDEDHEVEEIIAAGIEEELVMVASIGRIAIDILPGLLNCLKQNLTRAYCYMEHGSVGCESQDRKSLVAISEGIMEEARMAVLFAGYLLADEDEGEANLIPEQLMEPLRLDDSSADTVVDMVRTVLEALSRVADLLARNAAQIRERISPNFCQTLLWCVCRLCRTYFLPDPGLYCGGNGFFGDLPSPLTEAFAEGESSVATCEFLLKCVDIFLVHWPLEPDVCEGAVSLLGCLVTRQAAPIISRSPRWADFTISLIRNTKLSNHHAAAAIKQVVRGEFAGTVTTDRFWHSISPIKARFDSIVTSVEKLTKAQRQDLTTLLEVEACVSLFSGIVQGGDSTHSKDMCTFVEHSLRGMVCIFSEYVSLDVDTVVISVLGFFRDVAVSQLVFMSYNETLTYFSACDSVLKAFSRQNTGRYTSHTVRTEDGIHRQVGILLELLGNIVTKDCDGQTLDSSINGVSLAHHDQRTSSLKRVQQNVTFFGLGHILPMLSNGMLHYPEIQSHFFSLVSYVIDMYCRNSTGVMSPALLNQLLEALVYGAKQTSGGVARSSLQALTTLFTHCTGSGPDDIRSLLAQCPIAGPALLSAMFEPILSDAPIWDRLDPLADALFPLVTLDQAMFGAYATSLIEKQPQSIRAALGDALTSLFQSNGLTMELNTVNRTIFRQNMRSFATLSRSLLVVK